MPFGALKERRVIDPSAGATPVTVWWAPGVRSALEARAIAEGRDVGAVAVYDRRLDGRTLTFTSTGPGARDVPTGSTWGRDGRALSGPLTGRRWRLDVHDTPFWFAVGAFRPDARVVTGP